MDLNYPAKGDLIISLGGLYVGEIGIALDNRLIEVYFGPGKVETKVLGNVRRLEMSPIQKQAIIALYLPQAVTYLEEARV